MSAEETKEILDQEALTKQCRLYRLDPVGRIDRELQALTGEFIDSDVSLDAYEINQVDSMHYLGTDGTKTMLKCFPSSSRTMLDLGSGFGGCARFIAKKSIDDNITDMHVTALELQENISNAGQTLTKRCSLNDSVSHVAGDILDNSILSKLPRFGKYDVVFSKLVVLHIPFPERIKLWSSLSQAAPGGILYLEDYYEARNLSTEEREALAQEVGCPEIPNRENYIQQLTEAGYTDIEFKDVTDLWSAFVKERANAFDLNKERHIKVHGEETYGNMMEFYHATANLFNGKGLGGAVITARIAPKKEEEEEPTKKQKTEK